MRFIDKDGMGPKDVILEGPLKDKAFAELQKSVGGQLNLSMDANGKVTYSKAAPDELISADSKKLASAIDDHSVVVHVDAYNGKYVGNSELVGGAFYGNTVTPAPSPGNQNTVSTDQEINPNVLEKIDTYYDNPGASTLHEVTESYLGGKISQASGVSAGPATEADAKNPNSVYSRAHKAAAKQSGDVYQKSNSHGGHDYVVDDKVKPPVVVQSTP